MRVTSEQHALELKRWGRKTLKQDIWGYHLIGLFINLPNLEQGGRKEAGRAGERKEKREGGKEEKRDFVPISHSFRKRGRTHSHIMRVKSIGRLVYKKPNKTLRGLSKVSVCLLDR